MSFNSKLNNKLTNDICLVVSNEESQAVLEDLDSLQMELEIMLTDAMKRLRLLKNEFKTIDHKQVCFRQLTTDSSNLMAILCRTKLTKKD